MTVPEFITMGKDVILAIAGAVTACVAVRGLNTWARQLKGTANFEVARKLAKATYRMRNEIQLCRSPLIRAGEFPEGHKNHLKGGGQEGGSAYAHVFANRWAPVYEAIVEFDAQTLEAEAIWGSSIREKTDQLRLVARKLNAAMEAFISNELSDGQDFKTDRDFGVKIRSQVFASSTATDNELSMELQAAILAIEAELQPHLRRK